MIARLAFISFIDVLIRLEFVNGMNSLRVTLHMNSATNGYTLALRNFYA